MRIAIAGINHETNTYCREQTPLSAFQITRGEKLRSQVGTETAVGGALATCEEIGAQAIPIMVAFTQPSGVINLDAYLSLKDEILLGVQAALPLDGIFLDLHGAGVVDTLPDMEGDLVSAIRALVGETLPVTASFDLHGNITQEMCDAIDGVFACHQYPHIDLHYAAADAVRLIAQMVKEPIKTHVHVESLPMLIPTTTTFEGIGKSFLAQVLAAEQEAGVIDISWFHGFPYSDTQHTGAHIVVTSIEESGDVAGSVAMQVATQLWQSRELFKATSLSAAAAVAEARATTHRPVIINETSDNCGGGSPGDGTHLLRAMLEAELTNAAFGFIVDPEVAALAHKTGTGANISVSLGGKYDDLHGDPLELEVYVKALHDGRLTMQAMFKGARINYGKLARLQVGGMDIIVSSNRSQTFDTEPFLAVGIDVTRLDYVGLKSSNHFRAGFTELAGRIVTADPPGLTTHHIEVFPRHNSATELWPISANASYKPVNPTN